MGEYLFLTCIDSGDTQCQVVVLGIFKANAGMIVLN